MNTFNPGHYSEINLIAVDVQNDFCPGGSLAVEEGDMVVPALNRAMRALKGPRRTMSDGRMGFDFIDTQVIATRDWHPAQTSHFSENPNYQTNWPVHCVAGTEGAAFHPQLDLRAHHRMVEVISKGTAKDEDAYSGFDGTNDLGMKLEQLIHPNRRRTALVVGGLATDYCVKATVLDARNLGYDTFVLEDAIRGVHAETARAAIEEMAAAGAVFITTESFVAECERRIQ